MLRISNNIYLSKKKTIAKETEEAWSIEEYLNFVNGIFKFCWLFDRHVQKLPMYLLVHFVRVRVSSSIPASSLCSVRSQNSVDCRWLRMFPLHTARPFGLSYTGFLWPGHRLRFLAFSQRLIPSEVSVKIGT
jgi:hypothetical protein